ncbi:hypothetical protein D6C84_08099, partial [Aureobasidium pullulans]
FWCSVATANHILGYFSLVTGYGHFSARNPLTDTTFCHNIVDTPGTITSSSNIIEFNVANAPVVSNSTSSCRLQTFANTGVTLVPQLHLDGVLVDQYYPKGTHDFLVNLPHLGAALADTFSSPKNNDSMVLGQIGSIKDWPWFVVQAQRGRSYRNDSC